MILDDEELTRKAIRHQLEAVGFICFEMENAIDLINQLNGHKIDLLITDIVMDHKDGFEVFEAVKASLGKDFPIIAISSTATYLLMAEHLGAAAIHHKPLDMDLLIESVNRFLQ